MDFPKSQNDPPLAAFQRPVHQSAHFKKQRLQTTSASETQAERCASSLRPLLWSASSLDPALRSVCRLLGEGAGGGGGGPRPDGWAGIRTTRTVQRARGFTGTLSPRAAGRPAPEAGPARPAGVERRLWTRCAGHASRTGDRDATRPERHIGLKPDCFLASGSSRFPLRKAPSGTCLLRVSSGYKVRPGRNLCPVSTVCIVDVTWRRTLPTRLEGKFGGHKVKR